MSIILLVNHQIFTNEKPNYFPFCESGSHLVYNPIFTLKWTPLAPSTVALWLFKHVIERIYHLQISLVKKNMMYVTGYQISRGWRGTGSSVKMNFFMETFKPLWYDHHNVQLNSGSLIKRLHGRIFFWWYRRCSLMWFLFETRLSITAVRRTCLSGAYRTEFKTSALVLL